MSDTPDRSDDRLEGMLRRWGAEEAAGATAVRAASPRPPEARRRPRRPALRWLPVAAAATLLLAAGALFIASFAERAAATRQASEDALRIQALRDDLAGLQDLTATLARAGRQADRAADSARLLRARAEQLQKTADARAAELADANGQIASLAKDLGTRTGELAALSKELTAQQAEARAAATKLAAAEERAKTDSRRQQAAQEELRRMRDMHGRTLAAEREARTAQAVQAARLAATWVEFQQVYLATAAPHEVGLAARQAAARSRRMLARCSALRREAASPPTAELLDRLEVVLTRLDLMDPFGPRRIKAFASLVAAGGLIRRIDDTLAAAGAAPDMRTWLFEARAILMGADRVG